MPDEKLLSDMGKFVCVSPGVKRCPNPMPGDSEIEIRQIFSAEDFGEAFTPELREKEGKMRAQVAAKK